MKPEIYEDLQAHITAGEPLIQRTLAAAEIKPKRKPILKYTAIAAAAACLTMVGAVPVLASNVPDFYYALYKIAPQTAERFKPLEMISESNGIRMEVGGVYFHDNEVEAYITLQDVEGDRLNVGEQFYADCGVVLPRELELKQGYGYRSSTEYAAYDEESRTLTMLLRIEMTLGEMLPGDEVTFGLDRLFGKKTSWEGELDMIDLVSAAENGEFCEKGELEVYGAFTTEESLAMELEEVMLKPCMKEELPVESVAFTGAGYRDGVLHVGFYMDELDLDNNGMVYLQNANGKIIEPIAGMHGCEERGNAENLTADYMDYVFDVSENELSEYTLYGYFGKYTNMVKGDWEVTFTLPNEE